MTSERYGIAEWYGRPFGDLSPSERRLFAERALGEVRQQPPCPFQPGQPTCSKRGGVCSLQRYSNDEGRIGEALGIPATLCPSRFEEGALLTRWLAEIVGFPTADVMVAREVPFMVAPGTKRPAGKIDLVVAKAGGSSLVWYGLEIQAVYFSGEKMGLQFEALLHDDAVRAPFPDRQRRPDWRSSGPKRLMPQLQVKVPTLRRWGSKMAVAVDRAFFDEFGGPSSSPSQDLGDGDIIWLIPELKRVGPEGFRLTRGHWEVLTLEESEDKLLAAETINRQAFLERLRSRLEPLQ